MGAERTFDRDLVTDAELITALEPVIDAAWRRIERSGATGLTLTLKVKFADFRTITRSITRADRITTRSEIEAIGASLLRTVMPAEQGIRSLGLTLSGLASDADANAA